MEVFFSMFTDVIIVVLVVFALHLAWRLVRGVLRLIFVVGVLAFAWFFFTQPVSLTPAHRAHVAMHRVVVDGQVIVHHAIPRWQAFLAQVKAAGW